MGMPVQQKTPYIRSLTTLRKVQRHDNKAGKSGKKGPRPGDVREFPLLPVISVNDDTTITNMQMAIGADANSEESQNNVSQTIEDVIRRSVQWAANPDVPSLPNSATIPPPASRLLTLISPALPATALEILSLPTPSLPPSTLQGRGRPSTLATPVLPPSALQASTGHGRPSNLPFSSLPDPARQVPPPIIASTFPAVAVPSLPPSTQYPAAILPPTRLCASNVPPKTVSQDESSGSSSDSSLPDVPHYAQGKKQRIDSPRPRRLAPPRNPSWKNIEGFRFLGITPHLFQKFMAFLLEVNVKIRNRFFGSVMTLPL